MHLLALSYAWFESDSTCNQQITLIANSLFGMFLSFCLKCITFEIEIAGGLQTKWKF